MHHPAFMNSSWRVSVTNLRTYTRVSGEGGEKREERGFERFKGWERERGRKMYTETFLYTKHAEVFQKIT